MVEKIRYRKSGLGGYFLALEFEEKKYSFRLPGKCTHCKRLVINEADLINALGCVFLLGHVVMFLGQNGIALNSGTEPLLCIECNMLKSIWNESVKDDCKDEKKLQFPQARFH